MAFICPHLIPIYLVAEHLILSAVCRQGELREGALLPPALSRASHAPTLPRAHTSHGGTVALCRQLSLSSVLLELAGKRANSEQL